MALIDADNQYIKLLLDESFITTAGIYCKALVYKDKAEREKDKIRETAINSFTDNILAYKTKIFTDITYPSNGRFYDSSEFTDDEKTAYAKLTDEEISDIGLDMNTLTADQKTSVKTFIEANSVLSKLVDKNLYYYDSDDTRSAAITAPTLVYESAIEDMGYDTSWYTKVVLIRKDIIQVCPYSNQDFTYESFYDLYKNNVYLDSDGTPTLTDDI